MKKTAKVDVKVAAPVPVQQAEIPFQRKAVRRLQQSPPYPGYLRGPSLSYSGARVSSWQGSQGSSSGLDPQRADTIACGHGRPWPVHVGHRA